MYSIYITWRNAKEEVRKVREYLRELRKKRNYSQKDVASQLDISESYYCQIEKGNRKEKLDISLVLKLSKVFNIDVNRIIEFEKADL